MQLQKCIIPKLDPFHPDVKPFYKKGGKKNCTIKRVGRIVDGRLKAVLTGVEKAGFYYIRRHDEFSNKLSERKDLKLYDGKTIGKFYYKGTFTYEIRRSPLFPSILSFIINRALDFQYTPNPNPSQLLTQNTVCERSPYSLYFLLL